MRSAFPNGEAPPRVHILTDHEPLVHAARSLAPRAFSYNELMLSLTSEFPSTAFTFSFLPGRMNLADGLSRALVDSSVDFDQAREFAGSGWVSALANHLSTSVSSCDKCDRIRRAWH